MFFGTKPKRGLFGDALPDYSMPSQRAETAPPSVSMQPPKPEREAGTGIGAAIIGAIGDALLQRNGGQPLYAMQMMQRRQQAMQAQQQQAQRQADLEDWQRKFDYERANPKPANNDTISDYNFIAQQIGPEAANQYLRNMGDPMVNIPLANGSFYSGPRSGMGSALGGAPRATNPASDWDNAKPYGGASTQPAGRPFRY